MDWKEVKMDKHNNKRITIILSIPSIENKNVINDYAFFRYKQVVELMPEKLTDFSLKKIKNLFEDTYTRVTIKIEEMKINKLIDNRKIFIVSEIHYRKGSIYFDRLINDIFKKLMELN